MLESGSFSSAMTQNFVLLLPQISLPGVLGHYLAPLGLAALLGGAIGIERQLKRRPAGLRTHMLICFGSAMFTVLSVEMAAPSERSRIASQIVTGIGFIGAGSILHSKSGVSGLTTAATIFVVASIGMACGAGLYWLAIFGTILILLCLAVLGWFETRFNLKPVLMDYSLVTERSSDDIIQELNDVLDSRGKQMQAVRMSRYDGKKRISFSVDGTRREHEEVMNLLRRSPDLQNFEATPDREFEY